MTLRQKQSKFVRMIADLIIYAYDNGYELTFGEAERRRFPHYLYEANIQAGSHPQSNHFKRLAIDLHLFRDGVYLDSTKDHKFLGEYWESLGGTWGGKFGDGNHYSLEHEGIKAMESDC